MDQEPTTDFLETADIETASDDYATRFKGAVGTWFLDVQREITLELLKPYTGARVLEVASGTAQHVIYFASQREDVVWQPTDRDLQEYALEQRISAAGLPNIADPFALDIAHWPNLRPKFDMVYSANCIHIAPGHLLAPYVDGAARSLMAGGLMVLYGPFNRGGDYTSTGNREFDAMLRARDPQSGIRNFEDVVTLAKEAGLELTSDSAMPANNALLVFAKTSARS